MAVQAVEGFLDNDFLSLLSRLFRIDGRYLQNLCIPPSIALSLPPSRDSHVDVYSEKTLSNQMETPADD